MRRNQTGAICILLGLVAAAGVVGVGGVFGDGVTRLQTAVSDFVFLDENGPGFGRRPATGDVLVVLFDQRSVKALGGLPSVEQDLALYRALLEAGAKVIADTRMLAELGDPETSHVGRLLAGMAQLDAAGRLFRDIWLATDWPDDVRRKYRPMIAHNLLNMHPNAETLFASRLYPLVISMVDGFHESMPLIAARAALGVDQATSAEVLAELSRCGVAAAWQKAFPDVNVLPPAVVVEDVSPAPYRMAGVEDDASARVGGVQARWVRSIAWRPFTSQSSLVVPAGYWISYETPTSRYERVSYVDAASAAETVRDKFVIVGFATDTDPSSDTYATPSSDRPASAAETVAAALETLLQSRIMASMPAWLGWVPALAFGVAAALAGGLLRPIAAGMAGVALLAALLATAVGLYRAGWHVDLVLTPAACVLAGGLSAGYRYWTEVRARTRIIDLFGRYVPRAVVTQLVQKPDAEALALGGVKREVTVLFADIRGFTPFAERLPPEEVLTQLNSLLGIMVDATFAHGGTLDKFIGDSILVLFNAPLDQPDHALRAAQTAWAIQQGVSCHESGLAVGIGIHRGHAVVGTVGTPQRMEYTAIGSTVNIASRLCAAAASGQILLTAAAGEGLDDHFRLESQPPLRVKGVESELETSLVLSPVGSQSP
jgi:adenylate cyclase